MIKLAAQTLVEAFFNYPFYEYTLPRVETRQAALQVLFEVQITYALKYGEVFATSREMEGVICYISSKVLPISPWKMVTCGALKIPFKVGFEFIQRQGPIVRVQDALRAKWAKPPFVYLWNIGVKPSCQGQGQASRLLRHLLNQLAETGEACYLETAVEKNVHFYEHFGFEVMEVLSLPRQDQKSWAIYLKSQNK